MDELSTRLHCLPRVDGCSARACECKVEGRVHIKAFSRMCASGPINTPNVAQKTFLVIEMKQLTYF